MKRTDAIIAILLFLLCGAFVLWAFGAEYSILALLAAALSAGLMGICLIRYVPALANWLAEPEAEAPPQGYRESRFDRRHPWARIAAAVLLLHAVMYITGYAVDLARNGYSGGLFSNMPLLWLRSDAPSYLGIAANWYVTEGDPRFHIVFFPLYPILIKAVMLLVNNGFLAAIIVSNLCAVGSAIMAYELAALDMPRKSALYAALVISIFPGSIFLAAPMTESLFLALSLACVYCARKGNYLPAGAFGALAAFTRSVGALLVVPLLLEAIREYRHGLDKKGVAARLGGAAMVGTGALAYLMINYLVTGDPFTFLTYQREHWSQEMGLFFNTAAYQTEYFLSSLATGSAELAYTLHLPNLICCFGALAAMLWGAARVRPSYTAYAIVYFIVAVGPTWLLSGPRYLAVCFPLAFALAQATEGRRRLRWAVAAALALGMAVYLAMYVLGYYVY